MKAYFQASFSVATSSNYTVLFNTMEQSVTTNGDTTIFTFEKTPMRMSVYLVRYYCDWALN
jgi:hypothetical protein